MVETLKQKLCKDVRLICEVLSLSRSGYYAWKNRVPSVQAQSNQALVKKIVLIHQESRATYGLPRIHAKLKQMGEGCGKNRVHRLMKTAGIQGLVRKKFVTTTDSNHRQPIVPRVFQTEEKATHPTRPNQVWASDITYIRTREGFLFLAMYLDVFTRKLVGFATRDHLQTELIESALEMALGRQSPPMVNHSDRGTQYASVSYQEKLKQLGITASMSRSGNCYDNAFAETFFATLKKELIYRKEYTTFEQAKKEIFEYIEVWYNKKRLHSSLGYLSPIQFEKSQAA
jgi:transposase InsO family protein